MALAASHQALLYGDQAQAVRQALTCLLDEGINEAPDLKESVLRILGGRGKAFGEGGPYWALLTLAVCRNCGGRWEEAVPAAAAIEFFIAAGDLLDDIEDNDLPVGLDVARATNTATLLLLLTSKAVSLIADSRKASLAMRAISEAGISSCVGQHYDLVYESSFQVNEAMWLRMTELRSGSLAGCACRVGALVATDNENVIEAYVKFGRNTGVAAQIFNDLNSLKASSGKSDILRRKKTLPVIHALGAAEGSDRRLLHDYYTASCPARPEAADEVRRILERSGSLYYSAFLAEEYRLAALQALREGGVNSEAIAQLEEVLNLRG